MDASLIVVGLAGSIALIVFVFFFLGRLTDSILSFHLARKARRALSSRSCQEIVSAIDEKLEALEADIRLSKEHAAEVAKRGRLSGPYEGLYSEIRWLRRYREAVEKENRRSPRS